MAQVAGTSVKASAPSAGGEEDCRVTEVRPVQPTKAEYAIEESAAGKVTEVREVHPEKAKWSMEEREAGREREERAVQEAKAEAAMEVTGWVAPS
jgi:hypothetical protein